MVSDVRRILCRVNKCPMYSVWDRRQAFLLEIRPDAGARHIQRSIMHSLFAESVRELIHDPHAQHVRHLQDLLVHLVVCCNIGSPV